MGWINESAPEHEGYLVGLVPATNPDGTTSDWRFRELWQSAGDDLQREIPLRLVQVGCSCGWRSPYITAPHGTHYWPSYVEAPEWFENDCLLLWRAHVDRDAALVRNRVIGPQQRSVAAIGDTVLFAGDLRFHVGIVREGGRDPRRLTVAVTDDAGGCDLHFVSADACVVLVRATGVVATKMGPTLARIAKRACSAIGSSL